MVSAPLLQMCAEQMPIAMKFEENRITSVYPQPPQQPAMPQGKEEEQMPVLTKLGENTITSAPFKTPKYQLRHLQQHQEQLDTTIMQSSGRPE